MKSSATIESAIGWPAWFVFGLLAGCAGEPSNRLPVTGRVQQNSKAIVRGTISFLPAKGMKGPSATVGIVNGYYRFDNTNGPVPGRYQVVITRQAGGKDIPKSGSKPVAQPPVAPWNGEAEVTAKTYSLDFTLPP